MSYTRFARPIPGAHVPALAQNDQNTNKHPPIWELRLEDADGTQLDWALLAAEEPNPRAEIAWFVYKAKVDAQKKRDSQKDVAAKDVAQRKDDAQKYDGAEKNSNGQKKVDIHQNGHDQKNEDAQKDHTQDVKHGGLPLLPSNDSYGGADPETWREKQAVNDLFDLMMNHKWNFDDRISRQRIKVFTDGLFELSNIERRAYFFLPPKLGTVDWSYTFWYPSSVWPAAGVPFRKSRIPTWARLSVVASVGDTSKPSTTSQSEAASGSKSTSPSLQSSSTPATALTAIPSQNGKRKQPSPAPSSPSPKRARIEPAPATSPTAKRPRKASTTAKKGPESDAARMKSLSVSKPLFSHSIPGEDDDTDLAFCIRAARAKGDRKTTDFVANVAEMCLEAGRFPLLKHLKQRPETDTSWLARAIRYCRFHQDVPEMPEFRACEAHLQYLVRQVFDQDPQQRW